jgi:hypothetical protein
MRLFAVGAIALGLMLEFHRLGAAWAAFVFGVYLAYEGDRRNVALAALGCGIGVVTLGILWVDYRSLTTWDGTYSLNVPVMVLEAESGRSLAGAQVVIVPTRYGWPETTSVTNTGGVARHLSYWHCDRKSSRLGLFGGPPHRIPLHEFRVRAFTEDRRCPPILLSEAVGVTHWSSDRPLPAITLRLHKYK